MLNANAIARCKRLESVWSRDRSDQAKQALKFQDKVATSSYVAPRELLTIARARVNAGRKSNGSLALGNDYKIVKSEAYELHGTICRPVQIVTRSL